MSCEFASSCLCGSALRSRRQFQFFQRRTYPGSCPALRAVSVSAGLIEQRALGTPTVKPVLMELLSDSADAEGIAHYR